MNKYKPNEGVIKVNTPKPVVIKKPDIKIKGNLEKDKFIQKKGTEALRDKEIFKRNKDLNEIANKNNIDSEFHN